MPVGISRAVNPDCNVSFPETSWSSSSASSTLSDNTPRYMAKGFDPAKVPPEQLIMARTPKPLSAAQRLPHYIKYGFMGFVRQFKMLGIVINLYRHDFSVESIKKAAAKAEGGLLIKVLQFMCSSPCLLTLLFEDDAQKFMDSLSHVSTNNKPMTRKELEFCLKQADVLYDPERLSECTHLGTGSMGDVKEITLINGDRQVVKLISPTSEVRVHSDLKVLRFLLGLIDFFSPGMLGQGTRHAINEFFESVRDELNLVKEAQKTQKQHFAFQAMISGEHFNITNEELPGCAIKIPDPINYIRVPFPVGLNIPINYKVPTVFCEGLTSRTMCMEKINGATLSDNDLEKLRDTAAQFFNIEASQLSDELLEKFRQYLKNLAHLHWTHCYAKTGFFNGDMHDGNVMVAIEDGQLSIYFIDLGNGQWVSRDAVKATLTILGAMDKLRNSRDERRRDVYADMIIGNIQSMGEYDPNDVDWVKLKADIKDLLVYRDKEPLPKRVMHIFDLAYLCNIYIPREIVSLFRANILIGGQGEPIDINDVLCADPEFLRIVTGSFYDDVPA